MKMYCINDVFTEFLNSACENFAIAEGMTYMHVFLLVFDFLIFIASTMSPSLVGLKL